jgi:hypothetical protein
MFLLNQTKRLVLFVLIIALLTACNGNGEPPIVKIDVQPSTTILAGKTASLTADVSSGASQLQFKWTVGRGTLSAADAPAVIYTSPSSPGPDTVTVEVSNASGTTTKNITFDVVEPTPPPATPTQEPTFTPVSTATQSPTSTPPVPPIVETFPQVDGGKEFVFINQGGVLSNEFVPAQNCVHSGSSGLRFTYKMKDLGNGGWGVIWDSPAATHFDASGFTAFTFWVRGASGGETFQIGLKDTSDKEAKVESKSLVLVTSSWLMATVPLSEFTGKGVNTASVRNVNFGFNKDHGSGTFCIDDIAFSP